MPHMLFGGTIPTATRLTVNCKSCDWPNRAIRQCHRIVSRTTQKDDGGFISIAYSIEGFQVGVWYTTEAIVIILEPAIWPFTSFHYISLWMSSESSVLNIHKHLEHRHRKALLSIAIGSAIPDWVHWPWLSCNSKAKKAPKPIFSSSMPRFRFQLVAV